MDDKNLIGYLATAVGTSIGAAGAVWYRITRSDRHITDAVSLEVSKQLTPIAKRQVDLKVSLLDLGKALMKKIEDLHGVQVATSVAFGELSKDVREAMEKTQAEITRLRVNIGAENADDTEEGSSVKWKEDVTVISAKKPR